MYDFVEFVLHDGIGVLKHGDEMCAVLVENHLHYFVLI